MSKRKKLSNQKKNRQIEKRKKKLSNQKNSSNEKD